MQHWENIHQTLSHAWPFLVSTQAIPGEHSSRLNVQRIVEGLVIAAITAVVTMYGTQQVLDAKMEFVMKQIDANSRAIAMTNERIDQSLRDQINRGAAHGNPDKR